MTGKSTGWRTGLAAACLIVASVAPIAWIEARPRDESEVAVIFPPWTTQHAAFDRTIAAGGLVVRQGLVDTILVVRGDRPGLIERLYAAGAWAVIDPVAFGGCLSKSPGRRT